MNKLCAKCKIEKDTLDFYKRGKKVKSLHPYCKSCAVSVRVQFISTIRDSLKKGRNCCVCGYNKTHLALDFHHVNPKEKKGEIARMIVTANNKNSNKLFDELKKCILVCRNCHVEIHDNIVDGTLYQKYEPPKDLVFSIRKPGTGTIVKDRNRLYLESRKIREAKLKSIKDIIINNINLFYTWGGKTKLAKMSGVSGTHVVRIVKKLCAHDGIRTHISQRFEDVRSSN